MPRAPPGSRLSSFLQPQKEGKGQMTQMEDQPDLLDDGELLRQLFARFRGVPLFSGPTWVWGTHPFADAHSPTMPNEPEGDGVGQGVENGPI